MRTRTDTQPLRLLRGQTKPSSPAAAPASSQSARSTTRPDRKRHRAGAVFEKARRILRSRPNWYGPVYAPSRRNRINDDVMGPGGVREIEAQPSRKSPGGLPHGFIEANPSSEGEPFAGRHPSAQTRVGKGCGVRLRVARRRKRARATSVSFHAPPQGVPVALVPGLHSDPSRRPGRRRSRQPQVARARGLHPPAQLRDLLAAAARLSRLRTRSQRSCATRWRPSAPRSSVCPRCIPPKSGSAPVAGRRMGDEMFRLKDRRGADMASA